MNDFNFTPSIGLLDTSSFPTNPTTEAAARQQFMILFNQLKDFLNGDVKSDLAAMTNNQTLNLYGYKKLPGGVILQWGQFNASMQGANEYVIDGNFPIAFPSVDASKSANVRISGVGVAGTAYANDISVKIIHKSLTQFTAVVTSKNSSLPATSALIEWSAIGW